MQDKIMAANTRRILMVTASAFCLSSAGAYLAAQTFKGNEARRTEERAAQPRDGDSRSVPMAAARR